MMRASFTRPSSLLAVFLGLFVVLIHSQSPGSWIGEWRSTGSIDNFGGDLFTCADGNTVQGTFSGIGYIEGIVSGRNLTGTFRVGGFTDEVNGGFNWNLDNDNEGFTGYWYYYDSPCIQFPWNATRKNINFDKSLCYPLTTDFSLSVSGNWQSGSIDFGYDSLYICTNGDNAQEYFYASANFLPTQTQAYFTGRVFDSGVSAQGSYYDNNPGNQGISIFKMIDSNTLVTFVYNVPTFEQATFNYDDPAITKTITTWTRVGKSGQSVCQANANLAGIDWAGTWTDSARGESSRFYVCVSGTTVYGTYGEFGYVTGTVEGNKLVGEYYNAGDCVSCQGTFQLTLGSNGFSFTGYYIANNSTKKIQWNELRVDVTDLGSSACNALAGGSIDVSGRWIYLKNSTFDMCVSYSQGNKNNGTFTGSYDIPGESGYCSGVVNQNGQAAQVNCYTTRGTGVAALELIGATQISIFSWLNQNGTIPIDLDPCYVNGTYDSGFNSFHRSQIFSYKKATTNAYCSRYSSYAIHLPLNAAESFRAPSFGLTVLVVFFAVVSALFA